MNTVEKSLQSKELFQKLQKEFGKDFFASKKCEEVSTYVNRLLPQTKILRNFSLWCKIDEEFNFVGNNEHTVLFYNDKIYDYTSDQYVINGVEPSNGLRVLVPTTVHTDFGYEFDNGNWFNDKNYYICLNESI